MSNVAKLIARYLGRFIGLDLFSNTEWSCHADELFLMWKASFIPFETVYTGIRVKRKEAGHLKLDNKSHSHLFVSLFVCSWNS